ncbi:MAG: type I DNA topoisomerase [Clostridiales bacterium]|nr:type I DNA topoisomerase [Clostridiales bacterium]
MDLIIVESPSKAKTIEKYLKGKYRVDASGGHIRDLPERQIGVDIANNFEPKYTINADKKATIARLTEKAAKASKVYLATDPDREGEAISWHLEQVLQLKDGTPHRIEFNEITERAVTEALKNPREINMSLVDAQQARRVLDRLVGYKLSPFLCKRIKDGLSAGRVQSVALRMVCDREREILSFQPEEYWNLTAHLKGLDGKTAPFKAALATYQGKKIKVKNKEEAEEVERALPPDFTVTTVKKAVTKTHAPAPFTTSTLQQDGSNKLGIAAPQVMTLAQHLYEGIDTQKEGHIAFVTYIRTDSVRVSKEAQDKARSFIAGKYGKDFVPTKPNVYKTKSGAQDAHEAIRPVDLSRTPESVKDLLDRNHYRLYKLIYERFLASQMAEAKYNSMAIELAGGDYGFKATGRSMLFPGFTAVYQDSREETDEGDEKLLPDLKEGDFAHLTELKKEQKFTKPPVRYSDATLVKAMEDKGIGRPSTYASVIAVLNKRNYVKKEGKFMMPTEVAFEITDVLVKYFTDIMDVGFTANMEERLDTIEEGGKDWRGIIGEFYPGFAKNLLKAQADGDEITDEICEKCGHPMVRRHGRFGEYLACSNYPDCKNIKSTDENVSPYKCEKCGAHMVIKEGKFGKFLACPNFPECKNIKPYGEQPSTEKCKACGGEMFVKTGKFGKYSVCAVCGGTNNVSEMAGKCPTCGAPTKKMTSRAGKPFFGCSKYPDCSFMSWDFPTGEKCPKCGKFMVQREGKEVCVDKRCGYEKEED